MFIRKLYIVMGLVLAFGFFFEIVAHAEDMSRHTTLVWSAPAQNPVRVEPIGTYRYRPTELLLKPMVSPGRSLVTLPSAHQQNSPTAKTR